jgi:hypothetical protein
MADLVGQIMEYEMGTLSDQGTVELFSELVKTGMAWNLQGAYGRAAKALIEADIITPDGEITEHAHHLLRF